MARRYTENSAISKKAELLFEFLEKHDIAITVVQHMLIIHHGSQSGMVVDMEDGQPETSLPPNMEYALKVV